MALHVTDACGSQVETMLMRMGKRSHIDGLSGMARESNVPFHFPFLKGPVKLVRPLLDFSKVRAAQRMQIK